MDGEVTTPRFYRPADPSATGGAVDGAAGDGGALPAPPAPPIQRVAELGSTKKVRAALAEHFGIGLCETGALDLRSSITAPPALHDL